MDAIKIAFGEDFQFGEPNKSLISITGHYVRDKGYDSAEIRVRKLSVNQYRISGIALWGANRESGPNLVDIDFIAELKRDGRIEFSVARFDGDAYLAEFTFVEGALTVSEKN